MDWVCLPAPDIVPQTVSGPRGQTKSPANLFLINQNRFPKKRIESHQIANQVSTHFSRRIFLWQALMK